MYGVTMSDPVPLYGPRRTLNHDRVDPMLVAPQSSTVESIHIRITPKSYFISMSIGFYSGFRKVGEGFECSSLRHVVIPFVSLFNGLCCYSVIFIHETGVCFPCIHNLSSNDGFSSGTFVCRSVIAGSASRPS